MTSKKEKEMTEKVSNNAASADQKQKAEKAPPLNAKEEWIETIKTAFIAVIFALIIRTFMYEPFNIPSSSMRPTLDKGDYLFVEKSSYGYSRYSFPFGFAPLEGRIWSEQPERGDVVVFWNAHTGQNYIKRLIGLPGEKIQVKEGRLYINGEEIPRRKIQTKYIDEGIGKGIVRVTEYIETLPNGVEHAIYEESDHAHLDKTKLFTVPKGHYFMMGDNRDNSQDSRAIREDGSVPVGFVPFENFVGRADFIFFSTNGKAGLFEIWKWPQTIRYDHLFKTIHPKMKDEASQESQ